MCKRVLESILENKIVVIVRGVEKENLIPLAQAMYDGGIRLLEITYDATGKVTDEETAENIKMLSEYFEGKMYIGAGTVLTKKQVLLTKESGGKFIISPDANEEVIKYINNHPNYIVCGDAKHLGIEAKKPQIGLQIANLLPDLEIVEQHISLKPEYLKD